MSAREEAAEAARARGREKALFEVVAPLERNGRALELGQRIKLARADAEILIACGRIKPAKGKAKPAQDDEAPAQEAELVK
jgi:hypothetical protein